MTESFLNIACDELDGATELGPMITDDEVEVMIIDCKSDVNKNDEPYLLPKFEVVGEPTVAEFTKYLAVPDSSMDAKKRNRAALMLRRFCQCFDIDYSNGIDLEAMIGQKGYVLLGVDENEGSDFGPQNYIKRFMTSN